MPESAGGKNIRTTKSITMPIAKGIAKEQGTPSMPKSKRSAERSSDLNKAYQKPSNVKGLAEQVNEIATLVLNDKIDLEKARTYSALVRGVGQLMSLEMFKARQMKTVPNTDLQ